MSWQTCHQFGLWIQDTLTFCVTKSKMYIMDAVSYTLLYPLLKTKTCHAYFLESRQIVITVIVSFDPQTQWSYGSPVPQEHFQAVSDTLVIKASLMGQSNVSGRNDCCLSHYHHHSVQSINTHLAKVHLGRHCWWWWCCTPTLTVEFTWPTVLCQNCCAKIH